MKKLYLTILITLLLITGCSQTQAPDEKIKIVTTLFPLYDFARTVGGDHVDATLLLPPGVEPHSYEPRPSDIRKIEEADIFIYIGESMEPWAHELLQGTTNNHLTVIEAMSLIQPIRHDMHEACEEHGGIWNDTYKECSGLDEETCKELGGEQLTCVPPFECKENPDAGNCPTLGCMMSCSLEHEEEHVDAHDEHHSHSVDPHIWLNLMNDVRIVDEIAKTLTQLDSKNTQVYETNAKAYTKQLVDLDLRYIEELRDCDDIIIAGHNFFGYIEQRYGIRAITTIDNIEPSAEPTPKRIKEITDIARAHNTSYILTEELISTKMAEALSEEVGAEILRFNPAANIAKDDKNASFITIMEKNLETLKRTCR